MRQLPQALTPESIAQRNLEESQQPQSFFDDFAKSVTLYRDDDIWVIDKPHGLLSVDGKELKVSLQSRLLKADPNVKLIHRLDMDTSGIIILRAIARRKAISANNLSSVFRTKNTKRWFGERRRSKAKSMCPCATTHHKNPSILSI